MDFLSLAGLLLSGIAILGGNLLDGGHVGALVQPSAFVIVFGGTLGAVMLQHPWPVFRSALEMAVWVVRPPAFDTEALIAKVIQWSQTARKTGLLGLEAAAEQEPEMFTRRALQLLVDGNSPSGIRQIMEVALDAEESSALRAARVFQAAGGYAPTIGILGAVLGLIHVMNNLGDPDRLGDGIAVAFVATIYGVGSANLLFLPMSYKLRTIIEARTRLREMLLDGIVAIADGENPRLIDRRMRGYFYNATAAAQ